MIRKLIPVLGLVLITAIFFWQFFLKGLVPIPTDTIVGLYHPYRDIYAKDYPSGIPFKNFLITDPVRQQYPWREFSISIFKELSIPTWNPYSFSGTPNIANFQSAVFYPFNLLLFIPPFEYSWSFLILLQPLLASIFMYFYLRNLKLDEYSSFFGSVVFAFSGFFVTWLEWGTLLHTALWLPLILLSIDKIIEHLKSKKSDNEISIHNFKIKNGKIFAWYGIFVFSFSSSFFAGHLQTFFYLFILSTVYLVLRIFQNKNKLKNSLVFLVLEFTTLIITLPQSLPSLKFILLSGRNTETLLWQNEGWFLPWQHLVQFLVPDFFGNPATLNYWGTWNYGELTGYAGIVAITFALFAILFRRDKKSFLLGFAVILTLIIALQNPISMIPFTFNLPFVSTAQPTRILFITGFSLSILAALGLNYFIKYGKLKQILIPIIILGFIYLSIFSVTQFGNISQDPNNINVAKRNIFFPGAIFVIFSFLIMLFSVTPKKYRQFLLVLIIALTVVELFRFSWKFNTFSKTEYLYPEGKVVSFLKENTGHYRVAASDPRIMAPNFSIIHRLPSVEGYDPIYLQRYAEFVAAVNRGEPNISPPLGFNRTIRIENFSSSLVDLMGVKYALSLNEMDVKGFTEVESEGETKVFENKDVLPRAFFVKNIKFAGSKEEVIKLMFENNFNPQETAVIEENISSKISNGNVEIIKYSENKINIKTSNAKDGFLVLTDSFYPTWHVKIDGKDHEIYITDYIFRGVIVPAGEHEVVFENDLL